MITHLPRSIARVSSAARCQAFFSTTHTLNTGIQRIGTDVLPPMSQAVIHNNIVYLSGQVDATADDVVGQTKNVLAKVDTYLKEAGTDKSKLLTSSIWLKDIDRDFGAMNEVWNAWIDPNNKPVRATTQASLANPKMLVEIQVTAVKD
ncbi:hypothetical protein HJC23_011588 [Cyclotella cryptica]|uniref:Uncharacterized protein n=1 Tax=Cyclotella cryptica TaxID=29204 RepID=A0ABD3QXY9_9STRA|eukprot:CCRYP_002719-RA/>CCRYP_002719-RA protein AED:0.38 eAED:0.38 QI:0/-1/0/1/-1/1/1/0/147